MVFRFVVLELSAAEHWSSSSPLSSESSSARTSAVLLLLSKVNFGRTFGFPPIQDSISWKYFQVFLSAPVVLLWSVIFLWEASSLSHLRLHCSPVTFTSVEILLNSLAILLNMSFLVAFPFLNSSLCFCQQLTRSFTWKSSHRSSIECDRPVKKHTKCLNWSSLLQPQLGIVLKMSKCTSIVIFLGVLLQPHRFFAFSPFCHFYNNINFTGKSVSGPLTGHWKWREKSRRRANGTACFRSDRLQRKMWSSSEGCPSVPENFLWNPAFHLHFNRLNRKFWPNGKRPWSLTLTSISFSPRHWIMSPV